MNIDEKNMISSKFLYIFDSKVGGWARFFLPSNLIHFEIAKCRTYENKYPHILGSSPNHPQDSYP